MPTAIFGVVLILHGLVHLLYAGHSLRMFQLVPGLDWPDSSWLFPKLVDQESARKLAAYALGTAALGFVAAGSGFLLDWDGYGITASAAAVLSTLIFLAGWDSRFKELDRQGFFGVLINLTLLVLINILGMPA